MLKKIQSKPKLHYEKVQRDEVQRDEIQFPLPEHTDPSICRDVFLKNIVKEHELRIGSLRLASEIDDRRMTTIDEVLQPPETADTLCVKDFLRHRQGQALRKTREEHIASIRLRCSMLIDLNRQSQMAAMNFVSVRLRKQLNVFANPWPGKLDDIPNNLFSWSLEDFIDRMSLKQTYLDEFIWELSQQDLDCLKFRRDMKEIQLITYQICQEFFDGDELCEGSFQYMRDAKYITHPPWLKSTEAFKMVTYALTAVGLFESNQNLAHLNTLKAEALGAFERITAHDAIEMRYHINWTTSCADQYEMKMDGREQKLRQKLNEIVRKEQEDIGIQISSEGVYINQVEALKNKISAWQVRLDNDLEDIQIKNSQARSALQKLKDDLKFYQETQEMYLRQIDEARQLDAAEEKLRLDSQAGLDIGTEPPEKQMKAVKSSGKKLVRKRKSQKQDQVSTTGSQIERRKTDAESPAMRASTESQQKKKQMEAKRKSGRKS